MQENVNILKKHTQKNPFLLSNLFNYFKWICCIKRLFMQSVCWPAICWAKEKEHIQKPLYECSMQLDNCNYCTFSARRRLQNSIGILKERQSMDGNAKQLSGVSEWRHVHTYIQVYVNACIYICIYAWKNDNNRNFCKN